MQRITISIDDELAMAFDRFIEQRGYGNRSEAVRDLIREGRVLATADQHGGELAVYGIESALAILKGEAAPGDRKTPVDLVTRAQLP